jgi:hypothetical protein
LLLAIGAVAVDGVVLVVLLPVVQALAVVVVYLPEVLQ